MISFFFLSFCFFIAWSTVLSDACVRENIDLPSSTPQVTAEAAIYAHKYGVSQPFYAWGFTRH